MTDTQQEQTAQAVDSAPPDRLSYRDYQTFWTTQESPGWLSKVLDQAATWLRDRLDLDLDLTADADEHSPDRSKRAQVIHRPAGRETGMRLRVWNTNQGGTFVVTVVAVEKPHGGWLQINVTSNNTYTVAKKPRIADMFLDVVEFEDHSPLRASAEYTSLGNLDELEDLLNAPDRRLPVIVAAPVDGVPFDAWNSHVDRWTRQTVGIAHVASLDPLAAQEFENRHGTRAVRSGTLRTYPAGADLDDPLTARTARWLGHQSLAGDDRDVEKVIESFVRQHSISQPSPLPPESREWVRAFERIAGSKLRESVIPAPPEPSERRQRLDERKRLLGSSVPLAPVLDQPVATAPPTSERDVDAVEREELLARLRASEARAEAAEKKVAWVQDTLLLDALDEPSLTSLLDDATRVVNVPEQGAIDTLLSTNESLQSRIEALEEDFLNEQIEKVESRNALGRLEEENLRALREITYLRDVVKKSDPEAAFAFTDSGTPSNPLGDCPVRWDQLTASRSLKDHRIIFTGSEKKLREIASSDVDGTALNAAWDALGTLASYRAAVIEGSWDRDIESFCVSGPLDRFHVPPNKHSQGETGATKQDTRYKKARLLPVPTSVDKEGRAYMWAHFKPFSWTPEKKLRIHYLDQVSADGHIYVGHIGEHLPSASTKKVHR